MHAARNQWVATLITTAAEATLDLWAALKPLRTGTAGRKLPVFMRILPDIVDEKGFHFHTSADAAEALLAHFAVTEGGFLTTPEVIVDRVLHETRLRVQTTHVGAVKDLLSLTKNRACFTDSKGPLGPGPRRCFHGPPQIGERLGHCAALHALPQNSLRPDCAHPVQRRRTLRALQR